MHFFVYGNDNYTLLAFTRPLFRYLLLPVMVKKCNE